MIQKKQILLSLLIVMSIKIGAIDFKNVCPPNSVISVWHWASPTHKYGINAVINDPIKSERAIKSYLLNKVNRVYGGYFKMASTQKEQLKLWNAKLYHEGIKSIYLLGTPEWIYPEHRSEMLAYIKNEYISYNNSVSINEKLQGLHLDIEPHGLPEWNSASKERRREMLILLKDALTDVRELLILNGMGKDELMADVPFWFDHFDVIGWKSEQDRATWFTELAQQINGISIMNYENNNVNVLIERAQWEKDNFKGIVEIGLNFEETGNIWNSTADFTKALNKIADLTNMPVAIHRYTYVMEKSSKLKIR